VGWRSRVEDSIAQWIGRGAFPAPAICAIDGGIGLAIGGAIGLAMASSRLSHNGDDCEFSLLGDASQLLPSGDGLVR
jgi:hypothetical protein